MSYGNTYTVADIDEIVRFAITAPIVGMTPDEADELARTLMDAAERARMVQTDPKDKP
jgi:hypothetical protein